LAILRIVVGEPAQMRKRGVQKNWKIALTRQCSMRGMFFARVLTADKEAHAKGGLL